MSYQDILGMPVADVAADDSMLFLWVTDPFLAKGLEVMERWGFRYVTVAFTWVKTLRKSDGWHMGTGYYTRANPEMCLLGRRGSPTRVSRSVRQLVVERLREHSRKPDRIHTDIQALTHGPYLELFGRQQREGWTVWGNQTKKFGEQP
eukprot:GHVR01046840.1.p1 GENE.GHVR01046840.1~~GHVR01046840.1.p1  ORF type:complete len:148 (+),score=17.16 GHVR01046840.1:408-851(+)